MEWKSLQAVDNSFRRKIVKLCVFDQTSSWFINDLTIIHWRWWCKWDEALPLLSSIQFHKVHFVKWELRVDEKMKNETFFLNAAASVFVEKVRELVYMEWDEVVENNFILSHRVIIAFAIAFNSIKESLERNMKKERWLLLLSSALHFILCERWCGKSQTMMKLNEMF